MLSIFQVVEQKPENKSLNETLRPKLGVKAGSNPGMALHRDSESLLLSEKGPSLNLPLPRAIQGQGLPGFESLGSRVLVSGRKNLIGPVWVGCPHLVPISCVQGLLRGWETFWVLGLSLCELDSIGEGWGFYWWVTSSCTELVASRSMYGRFQICAEWLQYFP